jgi:hypothetical protein
MDDLVTWLRGQMDEDERLAREAASQSTTAWEYGEYPAEADHIPVAEHIERWDPARVLAEVDAKRRILDLVEQDVMRALDTQDPEFVDGYVTAQEDAVKLLALPYANWPGYDESWRP